MDPLPDWLTAQYPFAPRRFTTPHGAELSYVDEGQGSHAVLMVHGNPTWSFYYRELIKELAPHRRCIVPDHVGMGLSDKPANYPYTLATRIADLEALVDSLEVETLDLVVHDWGGAIGFGLAAKRPDKIRRIVILNTAAFASIHLPWRIALCRAPGLGPALVRGLNGFAWPATWMAMHRRALTAEQAKGYLHPYDSWVNRVAVSGFVQDIPMNEQHPSWATLRKVEEGLEQFRELPVLLLWGGRDFCFNDHFYHEWAERLPQAEQVYLEDAGHYVLEDAHNDAIPRIKEHLLKRD
jgi:haloalkane dehalogenase